MSRGASQKLQRRSRYGKRTEQVFVLDQDLVDFVFEGFRSTLKVGLGISRTNADSQWNPVTQVTRHFINRDLDAANLRPALEHVCGKQMSSAWKSFFPSECAKCCKYHIVEETEI